MTGVRTDHEPSGGAPRNIAYVFDLDDVRICHLGSITKRPAADEVEALSAIDVLLIPVGGGGALDAEAAAETVSLLEPKIVIPMRYKTEAAIGELEPVDKFLKEMGVEAKAPETRLNLTKSTVPADTTVVLLNYRG
jgi:L-ascorbate metabolism protein UlaG (beta-lactamase superfamily)